MEYFTNWLLSFTNAGGGIVKTRNMLLAAGAAGAVCWPKETVETVSMGYNYVKEPVVKAWTEYGESCSIVRYNSQCAVHSQA